MATKKQIADLHAQLTADVRQYITDMQAASKNTRDTEKQIVGSMNRAAGATRTFNDAQNLTGKTSGRMGFQMQQAGYQVQDFFVQVGSGTSAMRAFTQQAPQFLGVFGPAGAIAGAALAVGSVVGQLFLAGSATDEAIKKMESYEVAAKKLHETMAKLRFDNLSPIEQQAKLQESIAKTESDLHKLLATNDALMAAQRALGSLSLAPGPLGFYVMRNSPSQGAMDENMAKIGTLQNELKALQEQLAGVDKGIAKTTAEGSKKAAAETAASVKDMMAQMEAQRKMVEASNEALKSEGEAIRKSVLTPQEQLADAMEHLSYLFHQGVIDMETFDRKAAQLNETLIKTPKVIEDIKKSATPFQNAMSGMFQDVSNSAGDAFADMLLKGENAFSALADIVARSLIRITAQMAIVNPILNGLFGGFTGFTALPAFYGGGAAIPARASGGPVSAGTSYMVGEKGPELFTPSMAGSITSNDRLRGASSSGGGDSFNFTYNIGAGVTREQLLPILKAQQRDTIARIADSRRRGGTLAIA